MSSSAEDATEAGGKQPRFERDRHVSYFVNCLNGLPAAYESQESNRLTLAYFCVVALDLLQALDQVDRQKILNWVHSLKVLDPGFTHAKAGNHVTDPVATTIPPPLAQVATSMSTLSVEAGADVSSLSLQVGADVAPSSSEVRETAGCSIGSEGALCLGAEVLGFRGSPSIGVKSSTQGAPKQSPYDCSHIAMTYTALAILATLGIPGGTRGGKEGAVSRGGDEAADLSREGAVFENSQKHPAKSGTRGGKEDAVTREGYEAADLSGEGAVPEGEGREEEPEAASEQMEQARREGADGASRKGVDRGSGREGGADASGAGELPGMARSLRELQLQDGSFMPVVCGSESDMRFVFCAAAISSMIGDWRGVDVARAVSYIQRSQSFDGGFGLGPGFESHGGATYCAVAALQLISSSPLAAAAAAAAGAASLSSSLLPTSPSPSSSAPALGSSQLSQFPLLLSLLQSLPTPTAGSHDEPAVAEAQEEPAAAADVQTCISHFPSTNLLPLIDWCLQRQGVEGGFQGRPNKPADTCYAFWVGGTLSMLGADQLIDFVALRSFLFTCQNTRYGGFSKHPGGFPDILHSFYGVCGFCLAGEPGLLPLHVPLGISKRAAECFGGSSCQ
ncbi:hypothetical protein CLOP_g18602 [Closterium sp. NIES-67]|nr:hypothetical protein CLOP_g18602 [Closterium sp. NIES-67]